MSGRFELKKTTNGYFMFNLKAANGETILTSEQYKAKDGAKNGIDSVKKNAPHDSNYEKKTSANFKYYFVLKAINHEIIGTSEMYETSSGRDNGIASVKSNAPYATVVDLAI